MSSIDGKTRFRKYTASIMLQYMTKRITVMIDDDNHKKLRNLQSKMIAKSEGTVSFSKVINEILRKGL